jgi:hypothetical protein
MTTPMPSPDDFPHELLAAYADGELDADGRAAVERWLANNPDARDEMQTQRELSSANAPLWERAEPPEPSDEEWAVVHHRIETELNAPTRIPSRWRAATWTLVGLTVAASVAAAVIWIAQVPAPVAPRKNDPKAIEVAQARFPEVAPAPRAIELAPTQRSDDPLANFVVLPMATDDDVVLNRVPEFPAGWLPAGRHPLDGVMVLATEEELQLTEVAPNPAWLFGGPKMTTAPGDAPMIYAAKPR